MPANKRARPSEQELAVLELISGQANCSSEQAQRIYEQIFRLPDVVSLGILYHRGGQTGLEPMVLDKHAYLLIPHIDKAAANRVSGSGDGVQSGAPPDSGGVVARLQAVQNIVQEMNSVLTNIENMNCSEECKQRLRAMAFSAATPQSDNTHQGPSVTDVIQAHLGYLPSSYRRLVIAVETARSDTAGIVSQVCKDMEIYPRQRLLIARGQLPGLGTSQTGDRGQ